MEWAIEPGDVLKRRAVHELYGGQQQGGISTPANSDNILVFTDPKAGAKFGYDRFEGLQEDGTYGYTGQGMFGDQEFSMGNKALRDSAENGKLIRLFLVNGTYVTYVGSFVLADTPYRYEKVHDGDGSLRKAIVFNLLPLDADLSPVPADPFVSGGLRVTEWVRLDDTEYSVGSIELAPSYAQRVEFALQNNFAEWRRSEGHEIKVLDLPTGKTVIRPDIYDLTAQEVIEAKKSAARGFVRLAVGQTLDYVNNADRLGLQVSPAVLFPAAPEDDLVELCAKHSISLYVPDGSSFENIAA